MLYLMFAVALLALSLVTILPALKFERQRDQEAEMVHRGVQYSRAVRRYFRKFGGYPPSLDTLEGANNIRFLRKRYKDPITGQDFKALHPTDVKFAFGSGIAGARTLGQPIGGTASTGATQDPNAANGGQPASGTDPNANNANASDPSQPATNASAASNSPFVTANGNPAGDTMGGGPVVGVASTSTKETIRVYDKKNHYNQWQFVYDPSTDRGFLIVGPYQPTLESLMQQQAGQAGAQNGFGGLGGFGQGTGPGTMPGMLTPGTVNPNPKQ
jgi:type II secretory pathway pseudopilin PulG